MAIIALIIGLFCFLCIIGYFFSEEPATFAFKGLVIIAGLGFAAFVLFLIFGFAGVFR